MNRKRISAKRRAAIFLALGGVCHICQGKIDATRSAWEIEHVIPIALGGADDETNWRLAHVKCHRAKTAQDAERIAKTKRLMYRHLGAKRSAHPLPFGRRSAWKRRLNGDVVPR